MKPKPLSGLGCIEGTLLWPLSRLRHIIGGFLWVLWPLYPLWPLSRFGRIIKVRRSGGFAIARCIQYLAQTNTSIPADFVCLDTHALAALDATVNCSTIVPVVVM